MNVTAVLAWRALDVTLDLKDPQYPEHNLGTLELAVTLTPRENPRDAVRDSCQIILNTHGRCAGTRTHTARSRQPNTIVPETHYESKVSEHGVSNPPLSNFPHQSSAAVLFPVREAGSCWFQSASSTGNSSTQQMHKYA